MPKRTPVRKSDDSLKRRKATTKKTVDDRQPTTNNGKVSGGGSRFAGMKVFNPDEPKLKPGIMLLRCEIDDNGVIHIKECLMFDRQGNTR